MHIVTLIISDKVNNIWLFQRVEDARDKYIDLIKEYFPDCEAYLVNDALLDGYVEMDECFGSICISYNVLINTY